MKQNEQECMEEIAIEDEQIHNSYIDIKSELNSRDEAFLVARLSKEGFLVPQQRLLLEFYRSGNIDADTLFYYFSPDMDVQDMKDYIDVMSL